MVHKRNVTQYHVVGFEGLLSTDTSKYVHHLVLTAYYNVDDCAQACEDLFEAHYDEYGYYSSVSPPSSLTQQCTINAANIFVWAPGVSNLQMPEDVGFRNFQSVSVEIHYNNPDGDAGLVDNSGVRVYYSEELRAMEMGVMQLADPYIYLEGLPVPDGKSTVSFSCPTSCTNEYFEVRICGWKQSCIFFLFYFASAHAF